MSLPTVTINQLSGNSGRPLPGFDYYTGLMLYGTAPTVSQKWASYTGTPNIKAQQMFSFEDAAAAGILPNTDNTASTSTYLISTKGNTGDTIELKCTLPQPNSRIVLSDGITSNVISLGVYTVGVSENTIALQGAAWAVIINAGTITHGFTASFTTATLTVTAPKSSGISLNSGTPYSIVISATFVGTLTQNVVAGTASQYALWSYHIKEYFRIFPQGNLNVGIISSSSSFNEVVTLQNKAALGKLRQIGVYDVDATRGSAANITGTITQLDVTCKTIQGTSPFSAFYSPNLAAVSDLSTYTNQNLNSANKVETIICQDGNAAGALLFVQTGQTVGNIGAKLASIAKSRVSASDAQPIPEFNISDGVENNIISFGNGVLGTAVSAGLQVQLDAYNYTFFRQFGFVGTFWTGNKCCITSASDYANVNDNRVSDKVSRICYDNLIPLLNSEVIFNSDGTLQDFTIETFKNAVVDGVTADMITGFGSTPLISGVSCSIDPTQAVQATGNLVIFVTIVENGIARNITVNIAYGTI